MKAVLFDLDGVIIDTEGIYSQFWAGVGKKYGLPDDFADKIKGTTLHQILTANFTEAQRPGVVAALEAFEQNMQYRLFDGALELLRDLQDHGVAMAIVTSSGDDKMNRLWQQNPELKPYFDAIVTDSLVQRSKPDPQGYLIAADMVKCDAADCIVVEDSYNGLQAGRNSGAKVVALSTTNPADTLADMADMVAPSIASLSYAMLMAL